MLELIQENNVIIGIIIGIITLFITMRQIIISNQKHRMDKEDFISKRPNFSVYIENCYRISYNSSKHTHAVFCITIKNKSSYRNTVLPKLEIDYIENGIDTLKIQMQEMQERHGKQIRNLQSIHNQELEAKDSEISRLNTLLEKAFKWFPMLREMLRMEKLCVVIGFTKDMIDCLLTKKEAIQCNGKIYSEEHRRKFEIKNDIFKVERNPTDDGKLVLTINMRPIGEWFKDQFNKLQYSLHKPTGDPKKGKGIKL